MIMVAVYCRVSTDREDQANSFEGQQRYFKEYVEKSSEYKLYRIYADEGLTGTTTRHRRAFNQMIHDAKLGKFTLILTKEISRFARNTLDSIYYTRELRSIGVGVYFVNDNINTFDQDAELRLTILSSIAQEESRRTSQRVKWGQKRRMEQGVVFGNNLLGYDVIKGQLYRNEEGAKIVEKIFYKFISEGKGTYVIARELTEEGIKPKYATTWSSSVVLRILKNEKYCGDLVQKKTYTPDYLTHQKKYNDGVEELVRIQNHHEAIIDRETFTQVQAMLEERALKNKVRERYNNRYCYSGKIRCGNCGRCYVARRRKRADGSVYLVWRCYHGNDENYLMKDRNSIQCVTGEIQDEGITELLLQVINCLPIAYEEIQRQLVEVVDKLMRLKGNCGWERGTHLASSYKKMELDIKQERQRLLSVYMKQYISEEEFVEECKKLDLRFKKIIREGQGNPYINDKKIPLEHEERLHVIKEYLQAIRQGTQSSESLYRKLLDQIIRIDRETWCVHINGIPIRFIVHRK